jgi:O-antigen/teichoic acid export membrane protein
VVALWIFLRPALRSLPEAPTRPGVGLAFWKYALPRGSAAVLTSTVTWFDILLVGRYASTRDAAVYAIASRFCLAGTYALQAIGTAVAPQFSELLARRRRKAAQAVYQAGTWWAMCLSWPFYLLLMMFPSTILTLVFGSHYADASVALVILSAAGLVDLATGNAQALLLMSGRSGVYLVNATVSLTANVTLNLLLIPHYGVTGAAIAWATSIGFSNLTAAGQVRFFLDVRPLGPGFPIVASGAFVAFVVVPLLCRAFIGTGVEALGAAVAIGVPLFAVWIWRARDVLRLSDLRHGALAAHRASIEGTS